VCPELSVKKKHPEGISATSTWQVIIPHSILVADQTVNTMMYEITMVRFMHLNEYLPVVYTQRAYTLVGQESSKVLVLRVYHLERMETSYLYTIELGACGGRCCGIDDGICLWLFQE
jgi:hypothetical protein